MPVKRRLNSIHKVPEDYSRSVFLNIPYDEDYKDILVAYIAGLCVLNLKPRAALEVIGSERRLNKICDLIRNCGYSIHDLSMVNLDKNTNLPRFNMPFELGLAVALQIDSSTPTWFVFDRERHRLAKTLSDLSGTDHLLHNGTPEGIFRELVNLSNGGRIDIEPIFRPDTNLMQFIYELLQHRLRHLKEGSASKSPFEVSVFKQMILLANNLLQKVAEQSID